MRWFVTEAHLAWLVEERMRITEDYSEHEIARLREDHEKELARLTDQSPVLAYLKDELAFWRARWIKQEQKTEIAVDACRVAHQGVAAIALPLRPQGEGGAVTGRVEPTIFSDPELAAMGAMEGVG